MVNDTKWAGDGTRQSKIRRGDGGGRDGLFSSRRTFLATTGAGFAGLTGLAGCLGGGGGPTGPVKIGVLAPEPGSNPIGASIARSAELAAEQLNGDDGVLGEDVEVVVKDTHEDPSTGRDVYQDLTVGEEVDFTTGIFTSEVLLALMDSIAEQETIHLGSGAATPQATEMVKDEYEKYKYFFRTGPVNAHFLGQNMVDFAEANFSDMGWGSVYVLVEDYAWTKPVESVLQNQLGDAGVDVAGMKRYAGGTEDFSTIYDQVEESGADAAYIAMAHTGTPAVVQWIKQQRPFEFGGIHVPMQLPSYYQLTEGACRFALTQNTATPTSEVTDKTVPYAEAYNEAFDKYPVYTGYITYDAVMQYASAVESTESRVADDVISHLESEPFTGTAGTIRYYGQDEDYPHDVVYDPDGENGVRPLWLQWQEQDGAGQQVSIFPDEVAEGSYRKPPWV